VAEWQISVSSLLPRIGRLVGPAGPLLAEMNAMSYVYSLPTLPSYTGKGFTGYEFGKLQQRDLTIDYVEVEKGHDTFMISKKIMRTYYILSGSGHFTINDRIYAVSPGTLMEVPPKVEYCYSGKMKLILFQRGRWLPGNDTHTKWNPDVVRGDYPFASDEGAVLRRLVRLRIFGQSPIGAYLRLNRRLWQALPTSFTALNAVRAYGHFLHALVRMEGVRAQAFATYFLRNRPQLELIRRLAEQRATGDTLRVAVLGCSTGVEAHSVAWRIQSARPDLRLRLHAVDISKEAVEVGKSGAYPIAASQWTGTDIFERMTEAEIGGMFERNGDVMTVRPRIREGIEWCVGDVGSPEVFDMVGPQDIVVANNFLCHMDAAAAEQCLRNIGRLVCPHGYLFVSGVDLSVRTKVANDSGWRALEELLEEIHDGDPCMKSFWPWHYGGLEPLNKRRRDWKVRYAAAFEVVPAGASAKKLGGVNPAGDSVRDALANHGVSAVALLADEPTRLADVR
jgi:chemotaxis methyl-accepting protein methylase/mannose-6-phosphate isomerase-like protein (cupin superfamily)